MSISPNGEHLGFISQADGKNILGFLITSSLTQSTLQMLKIKVPLLIIHGGRDERAPIEQAESLIKALKAANVPYEYMLLEDEGHGFYKPKHRAVHYDRVLAFLEQHLSL